jgi:hypothetical protein
MNVFIIIQWQQFKLSVRIVRYGSTPVFNIMNTAKKGYGKNKNDQLTLLGRWSSRAYFQ